MRDDRRSKIARRSSAIDHLERRVLLSSGLSITYNTNGINTLSYNGATLINSANGDGFQANRYYTLNSDGSTYTAVYAGNNFTSNWNSTTDTLTYTYPAFGSISVQYVQANSDRLNMIFTVSNNANSGVTLGGVDLYPARIHFPDPIPVSATNPNTWYPLVTSGIDGPGIIPANYTSGSNGASMAFVNDSDVTKPMYTSLYTLDNTTGENYYLWVGTGPKDQTIPNEPVFYRQTAPGQTDTFEASLRFGPAGEDPMSLATDVEAQYRIAYPSTLDWPDRRPIASLHLTSPPTHGGINPEGWFNNSPTENTTTQSGLNQFGADLINYANASVVQMQNDNAPGMIVWDVEGQKWPQATTYIGDASLAFNNIIETPVTLDDGVTSVTPMGYRVHRHWIAAAIRSNGQPEPLIDQFFQIFRNAGFRTGMTIRPTQITFSNGVPSQTTADEVTELETKISYAYNRWGSTLFYLDSNSGYDRDELRTVAAAFPNVLIMPEHADTSLYSATAPYGQWLTYNVTGTPAAVRDVYPNAFSVVYPADGSVANDEAPTEANVALGDVILFRGWFHDSYNDTMNSMYQQAVASVPSAPTGLSVAASNGVVNLSWNANNGVGIYDQGVYNVKRSTTHNGPYTTIASGIFGPGYTDSNVTNGTAYYYVISALNGRGESGNSSENTGTPAIGHIDGNSTLEVSGTGSSDIFTISQSGSLITVSCNSANQSFDASTINAVVIAGLALDDTLNFNGSISKPVTFNGGSGISTLNINSGTFTFTADANVGSSNLSVNVAANASVNFDTTQHLAALTVNGTATMPPNGSNVLVTSALSIPSGTLDLNDNDLILNYSSATQLPMVQGLIKSAFSNGTWLGNGITSTTARTNSLHNTSLGLIEASQYKTIFGTSTFDGESITNPAVLVKYTYQGDANLDGTVNSADFALLASHYGQTTSSWASGDFNYDNTSNALDFNAVAANYGASPALAAPAFSTASIVASSNDNPSDTLDGQTGNSLDDLVN